MLHLGCKRNTLLHSVTKLIASSFYTNLLYYLNTHPESSVKPSEIEDIVTVNVFKYFLFRMHFTLANS